MGLVTCFSLVRTPWIPVTCDLRQYIRCTIYGLMPTAPGFIRYIFIFEHQLYSKRTILCTVFLVLVSFAVPPCCSMHNNDACCWWLF